MRHLAIHRGRILARALAAAVAAVGPAFAYQSLSEWEEVEAAIWPASWSRLAMGDTIRADARMDREHRKVVLTWRYSSVGDFGGMPDALQVQELPVRFLPTTVDFASPDKLLVAGKTPAGRVTIEVWTLQAPTPLQLADGSIVLQLLMPEAVDTVLDVPESQYGLVQMLVSNRGLPGRSFVRFTAVDDLFQLDWSGLQAVTPTVALSVADEPALAERGYGCLNAGHHALRGYVYVLRPEDPDPATQPLYLFDGDLDGAIDPDHGTRSTREVEALGLLSIVDWIEYCGVPPE